MGLEDASPKHWFSPGEEVRILAGMFATMKGIVISAEEVRRRRDDVDALSDALGVTPDSVWVEIDIYGRPIEVPLEPENLALA